MIISYYAFFEYTLFERRLEKYKKVIINENEEENSLGR